MGLALLGRLASGSAQTHFASCFAVRVGSIPRTSLAFPLTEGVGFEPTRSFRTNALAGRRLKPLGHPSKHAERTRRSH